MCELDIEDHMYEHKFLKNNHLMRLITENFQALNYELQQVYNSFFDFKHQMIICNIG
jgi:hypothetical protein